VSEKFDILLRVFTGHSLKDELKLWQPYKELRSARNSLVHEGVAKIGTTPVDWGKTKELIIGAEKVIKWVEELLPAVRRRARTEAVGPFSRRLATVAEASGLESAQSVAIAASENNQGDIRIVRRDEDPSNHQDPQP
jgi:hypothetical protein